MLLSLQRISKRFEGSGGRARQALEDVTLQLERGQMVGIYGPTGAGKSTLLRIAAGMLAPDGGQVLYDGQPLHEMSPARAQAPAAAGDLLPVERHRERYAADRDRSRGGGAAGRRPRPPPRRAAAQEALAACAVQQCAHTDLRELSGGERQRVEIARAIVTEPKLLLADGPASSLSLIEQEAVMAQLAALARQARVGVLVADSDAAALIGAETILYLNEGRILDCSPERDGGNVYQLPRRPRRAAADA